jgi:hypothetical protein
MQLQGLDIPWLSVAIPRGPLHNCSASVTRSVDSRVAGRPGAFIKVTYQLISKQPTAPGDFEANEILGDSAEIICLPQQVSTEPTVERLGG